MLKKQWETTLGIYCRVEAYDWHTLFDKMTNGNYQVGSMTWKSWIDDPIYTLGAFKYQSDQVNFPKWEKAEYCRLLDLGEKETELTRRSFYFSQAETLLIKETPLVPIYYELEKFLKNDDLDVSLHSSQLDFKWVQFKNKIDKEISYVQT
jgi:oligopeptide transport system substrate-binding protein